jgi:isopenicillin N synthase-like dioxygenase
MSVAARLPSGATSHRGRIPVLDTGPYLAGSPGAAGPFAGGIARAFEDTEFLVVANHGVPPRLVEGTVTVAAQFFAHRRAEGGADDADG